MWTHGATGYNYGCRCKICKAVKASNAKYDYEKKKAARKLVNGRLVATRLGLVHGNRNAYTNWQCRCDECIKGQYI